MQLVFSIYKNFRIPNNLLDTIILLGYNVPIEWIFTAFTRVIYFLIAPTKMTLGKRLAMYMLGNERPFYYIKISYTCMHIFSANLILYSLASGGSSVSQNKLPQLILEYNYILKYLQSNFIG